MENETLNSAVWSCTRLLCTLAPNCHPNPHETSTEWTGPGDFSGPVSRGHCNSGGRVQAAPSSEGSGLGLEQFSKGGAGAVYAGSWPWHRPKRKQRQEEGTRLSWVLAWEQEDWCGWGKNKGSGQREAGERSRDRYLSVAAVAGVRRAFLYMEPCLAAGVPAFVSEELVAGELPVGCGLASATVP